MRDFQSLTLTCFHENSTQKQYLSHIRWNQLWRILQCSSSHYSTMIWRYTTYLNVCDKGTTSISSYGEYWHVYRCYQNVIHCKHTSFEFFALCFKSSETYVVTTQDWKFMFSMLRGRVYIWKIKQILMNTTGFIPYQM